MVSRPGAGGIGGGGVERLSFLTARSKHPGAIETHGHLLHFNNGFPSSPPPFSPPPPPRYHHPELRTWNTGERATLPAHSRFTVSFMERNGGRSNQGLTISSMDECIIRPNLPLPLPNAATCRRGRRFTLPGKIVWREKGRWMHLKKGERNTLKFSGNFGLYLELYIWGNGYKGGEVKMGWISERDTESLKFWSLEKYIKGEGSWWKRYEYDKRGNFDFWLEEISYSINGRIGIDSFTRFKLLYYIYRVSKSVYLSFFRKTRLKTIVNDVWNKVKNSRNGITLCNLTFNQRYNRRSCDKFVGLQSNLVTTSIWNISRA